MYLPGRLSFQSLMTRHHLLHCERMLLRWKDHLRRKWNSTKKMHNKYINVVMYGNAFKNSVHNR